MFTRFTLGQDNRESFCTITSAAPCWNVAATRFTFIRDCWTCARIIISLLAPARYGQQIKKEKWNERFSMYANHSGPAELSPRNSFPRLLRAGYRRNPPQSRPRHLHRISSAQNAALRREKSHRARILSGEPSKKYRFR